MTFDQYVQARRPALLRLATVLSGDGGTGEDVVQSVLAKAYQRWEHIQAADKPDAYMRRMLVNEYLSWRRKWARITPMASLDDLVPTEPDHGDSYADQVSLLREVLRLPRRQRAAVVLRYYEDLDDSEIAAALGCAQSTVRSNIARALATLHVALEANKIVVTET